MDRRSYSYLKQLKTELLAALSIGAVVLPLVFISNSTASFELILTHAVVLLLIIPVIASLAMMAALWRSRSTTELSFVSTVTIHIGSIFLGITIAVPLISKISKVPAEELISKPLAAGVIPICLAYVIWDAGGFYRRTKLRAAVLEVEKTRRAFEALTAKIKPHFLFNTLSSLEQLVDVDPERAKRGITRLSALYRLVLAASEEAFFPVSKEASLAKDYLLIQQIRFGERLRFEMDIPEDVSDCPVPATLMLTLVENAVKHGIEPSVRGGLVTVTIRQAEGRLMIRIVNPKSRQALRETSGGYGLKNGSERLLLLFGGAASLALTETQESVVVTAEMPLLATLKKEKR